MITVFYRIEYHWSYPQIDFINDGLDDIVFPDKLEKLVPRWIGLGLNQSVLANGYDDSIYNVRITRQKR